MLIGHWACILNIHRFFHLVLRGILNLNLFNKIPYVHWINQGLKNNVFVNLWICMFFYIMVCWYQIFGKFLHCFFPFLMQYGLYSLCDFWRDLNNVIWIIVANCETQHMFLAYYIVSDLYKMKFKSEEIRDHTLKNFSHMGVSIFLLPFVSFELVFPCPQIRWKSHPCPHTLITES